MRIPECMLSWLYRWAARREARTPPDFTIKQAGEAYLERRYIIPRNRFLNVYLHVFRRGDDDRALHDHPWWNLSLVLYGTYREIVTGGPPKLRREGDVVLRRPTAQHRIELSPALHAGTVVTLFITGPRVRVWGFQCPQGWRRWDRFVDPTDSGTVGPGCD